jgi:hypothetical protein
MLPVAALFLSGCGAELYEERLGKTQVLYSHINLLNEHLQGMWTDSDTNVGLRIPKRFDMLPPPAKPDPAMAAKAKAAEGEEGEKADEDEEDAEVIHDDRQPKYVNVELPGLRGAFLSKVKCLSDSRAEVTADAWLYVMTNHDSYDQPEVAKDFNKSFVTELCAALEVAPPEPEKWESDKFPARVAKEVGPFVQQLSYTVVVPEKDIDGVLREFKIYMYQLGEVQVIVLFVVPKDCDASEKLTERIAFSLETLAVPGEKLSAPTGGGLPPGGAPGTSF